MDGEVQTKKPLVFWLIVIFVLIVAAAALWYFTRKPLPSAPPTGGGPQVISEAAHIPGTTTEVEHVINEAGKQAELVKVSVEFKNGGVTPKEFKVKANTPLIIYVASKDSSQHVFRFEGAALKKFAAGVQAGEISAITLTAPAEKGNYIFFDESVPRSEASQGVMMVE